MMKHNKLYTQLLNAKEWRELRAAKLAANPLCERCLKEGYYTAASCIHHITPVETGRTDEECRQLAYSWSNLQALCHRCHAEIHKEERSHSRVQHQQRAKERLQQWIERHKGRGRRQSNKN